MKNILVAYDGGEPAHRALQTAIDLAKQFGGSLSVVSVVPSTRAGCHRSMGRPSGTRPAAGGGPRDPGRAGVVAEMIEPAGTRLRRSSGWPRRAASTRSSWGRGAGRRRRGSSRAACPSTSRPMPGRPWSSPDDDLALLANWVGSGAPKGCRSRSLPSAEMRFRRCCGSALRRSTIASTTPPSRSSERDGQPQGPDQADHRAVGHRIHAMKLRNAVAAGPGDRPE